MFPGAARRCSPNRETGEFMVPSVDRASPLRRAFDQIRRTDFPVLVLVGMVALWIALFGVLVWQRHDRFGSFGFDMGIFDQAVWLAARGESFITVRGLDLFGHHANVAFYLLAPFSWLGAGAHFLNLLQVTTLALGAVPLYLLGRHRELSPWIALAPAAAYLLHPSTQFLAWELFHPETVAIAPLLFAYVAAVKQRWGWYAGLLVFAVAWKEDLALAAFAIGLIVLIRGHRKIGGLTMGLSLAWFLVVNRILLSAVNGEGAFYDQFYGDLGGSPFDIAWTGLVHPTQVLSKFADASAVEFVWQLAAPFALLALASPLVLLVAVPQLVANILSVNEFTREITFHYAAVPLAALALASVEGLARVARSVHVRRALAVGLLVTALAGTVRWGPSPIGERWDEGFWPRAGDPRKETKDLAVDLVPDGVSVSASYQFVPHLTHREGIYEFPNPFRERNWGVQGENTHDPATVEWLAVDTRITGRSDRAVLEAQLSTGAWDVVLDEDGILVARRRAPRS